MNDTSSPGIVTAAIASKVIERSNARPLAPKGERLGRWGRELPDHIRSRIYWPY